jgi:uncharacterized phage protein gp47/JayE
MADYGLTVNGFVLKRLNDILIEQRARAVTLFQDLVEPGDSVDTSDSSLLGRLIALDSPGDADLWELAQAVYSAFDPNSASGIALDNLVALGGLTRQGQTYSTAALLVSGNTNTQIPFGSEIQSSSTGERFTTTQLVALDTQNASGVTVTVGQVLNNTLYRISYTSNSVTQNINYTSDNTATESEILNGLQLAIASGHPTLSSSVEANTLVINKQDVFQTANFTASSNLSIIKVRKLVDIIATNPGPVEQLANTITTITTPVLGWDSATNPTSAVVGRLEETDEELRLRFRNSKFEKATNILDSLYSSLFAVDGVEEVIIYENDTNVTDSNGVPPHSFLPIVLGGVSVDIANAIWQNKPIGILSYGNTTVSVNDSQGFPHDVSFSRPEPVVIYITVNLTTDENFPGNGVALIKAALVEYFQNNFGIGDDIVYSRLYTAINSVPGHQVDSLYIGTSPNPTGTSNIVIDFDEIANINDVNIQVNT